MDRKSLKDFENATKRREYIEEKTHTVLSALDASWVETTEKIHCENLIGSTNIPLGVAGPLTLSGEHAKGECFIPLATTEGALVASVSRGAKAASLAGGVTVSSYKLGTTRGPVFYTGGVKESKRLFSWIKENEAIIKETAESTSSHLKYKKASVRGVGPYVFVRFSFDTGDAMGMNMVTIATQAICSKIEQETGFSTISVAGNFDIDKKPAFLNSIHGRGHEAWAEVVISKHIVEEVLKTTPKELFDVWLAKCMVGSAVSGSLGFNSHFANIIAALFLATGQDAAHVVEGSLGITIAKVEDNGDLYFSVYLPAVMVGTVGGGTHLPTQHATLEMLGVAGSGNVEKFAEIVAGAVLAGELSLLASLAQCTLASAHKKLGR